MDARGFPAVSPLANNVLPAISRKPEKSRLFRRKVLGYSSENSFWLKNVGNFMIPKAFSLEKKSFDYLSNSRYNI